MDKELTPKQQTSEAIRQAEAILIMTGQRPTVDQVAGTIALATILRKFGKKVTAVVSDDIPVGARFLTGSAGTVERNLSGLRDFTIHVDMSNAELDKLKYDTDDGKLNIHITPFAGSLNPQDVSFDHGDFNFDLVIILGVASYGRIDRLFQQHADKLRQAPLINVDFHRNNEQYGAVNLLEISAASLAEILMALSESLQPGLIDGPIATIMLTGIMAATDRFTSYYTTAKTMTVAAQMMALGADQQKIVKGLYQIDRGRRDDRAKDDRPKGKEPRPQIQSEPSRLEKTEPAPQQAIQKVKERIANAEQPTATNAVKSEAPKAQTEAGMEELEAEQPEEAATAKTESPKPQQPELEERGETLEPQAHSKPEPTQAESSYEEPELPEAPKAQPAISLAEEAMPLPPLVVDPNKADQKASQTPSEQPVKPAKNSTVEPSMEELLPPHHIELSEPEGGPASDRSPLAGESKAANPTNNPVFHHRRNGQR